MKTRIWLGAIVWGVLLGVLLALALNDYLAISFSPKELPEWEGSPREDSLPPLPLRMVDLGGVGIEADSAEWGSSYSHNPRRFERALSPDPPFVRSAEVERLYRQFDQYAGRMAALGFNAIELGGFIQLIDFDGVGDGLEVYAAESVYRKRHETMRGFFGTLFKKAADHGLSVYLRTDMVTLSGPLEDYLDRRGLTVEDPGFWEVYQAGLGELFARFPQVKGVIIRIGEAGTVYNQPGNDYRSELWVRDATAVQFMLRSFLKVAEPLDRDIIFRSWTVGVGDVGNLHTDPATYERVLGPIDSANLIVSTKVVEGDFWSHLPLNQTLFSGRHRRIVELQARREYEAFNVIPNFVGGMYQGATAAYVESNPLVEGLWVWTQGGGPLRRGPMMTYPFHGNWVWTDANVYASAQLAMDPGGNPRTWIEEWAEGLGFGEADQHALVETLAGSHRIAARGLTVPGFAEVAMRGMGLAVPPVIYAYWDIVDGSSAVGSHIYTGISGDPPGALRMMDETIEEARRMRERLATLDPANSWTGPMQASLDYEIGLMETLHAHKTWLLTFYSWLDKGGSQEGWRAAAADFRSALQTHRESASLDYPAYNFSLAERSIAQAERVSLLRLLAALVLIAGLVLVWRPSLVGFWFWAVSLGALFGALSAVWFTILVGGLALFLIAGVSASQPQKRAVIIRARLLPGLALLALMAIRGPQFVWFLLWTSDGVRLVLCALLAVSVSIHAAAILTSDTLRPHAGGLVALGAALFAMGGSLAAIGLEASLTALNEELLILPGMLSRVMGITTYLNIPDALPRWVATAGLIAAGVGLLLWLAHRRLAGERERR